jgi:hypothetical protein
VELIHFCLRLRSFLFLPGAQSQLYTAMAALQIPIVVVLINGGTVAVDEMKGQPLTAILDAWYPGARGAEAIADMIFGVDGLVPSGKLAATVWARDFQDLSGVEDPATKEIDFAKVTMLLHSPPFSSMLSMLPMLPMLLHAPHAPPFSSILPHAPPFSSILPHAPPCSPMLPHSPPCSPFY